MSNYIKTTNFAAKDALPTGSPDKVATGTSVDIEFNNIATSIATKADTTYVDSSSKGASLVEYLSTVTGAIVTTAEKWMDRQPISIFTFMTEAQRADVLNGTLAVDVSAPFQTAINWLSNNKRKKLFLPSGSYRLDSDIYAYYDAALNSGFNPVALQGGGISVEGEGRIARNDYRDSYWHGSLLKFALGKGLKTSNAGVTKTWGQRWTNLSVIGNTTGILWDASWSPQYSLYDNLFIGNADTTTAGQAFLADASWTSQFSNMDVVGRQTLTVGAAGRGFVFRPQTSGGGNNLFLNITSAYFGDYANQFGNTYAQLGAISSNNQLVNVQGQYSQVGLKIMYGMVDSVVQGYWGEWNTVADIWLDNSARGITFLKGTLVSGDAGLTAQIILGNNTGTATTDDVHDIVFDGISVRTARPGVYKHTAAKNITFKNCPVTNGGHGFVQVPVGDIGGEVIFENNNYFPVTNLDSTTITELPRHYRYFTYPASVITDASYLLRRADFAVGEYSGATLDMTTWRYPAEEVVTNTLSNSVTILLPANLAATQSRKAKIRVVKPMAANTTTIDAGTGYTIKGVQTIKLKDAYSSIELEYRGSGTFQWNQTSPQTPSVGTFTTTAGVGTVTVSNVTVNSTSKIMITQTNAAAATMTSNFLPYISAKTNNTSFTVTFGYGTGAGVTGNETYDYVVFN